MLGNAYRRRRTAALQQFQQGPWLTHPQRRPRQHIGASLHGQCRAQAQQQPGQLCGKAVLALDAARMVGGGQRQPQRVFPQHSGKVRVGAVVALHHRLHESGRDDLADAVVADQGHRAFDALHVLALQAVKRAVGNAQQGSGQHRVAADDAGDRTRGRRAVIDALDQLRQQVGPARGVTRREIGAGQRGDHILDHGALHAQVAGIGRLHAQRQQQEPPLQHPGSRRRSHRRGCPDIIVGGQVAISRGRVRLRLSLPPPCKRAHQHGSRQRGENHHADHGRAICRKLPEITTARRRSLVLRCVCLQHRPLTCPASAGAHPSAPAGNRRH